MKCPFCKTKMEYNETFSDDNNNDEDFPYFMMDYWCERGHLIQAIANKINVGWQVLIMNDTGDELVGLWYSPDRVLLEVLDWDTQRSIWS